MSRWGSRDPEEEALTSNIMAVRIWPGEEGQRRKRRGQTVQRLGGTWKLTLTGWETTPRKHQSTGGGLGPDHTSSLSDFFLIISPPHSPRDYLLVSQWGWDNLFSSPCFYSSPLYWGQECSLFYYMAVHSKDSGAWLLGACIPALLATYGLYDFGQDVSICTSVFLPVKCG